MAYELDRFNNSLLDMTPSSLFRDFSKQFFNTLPDMQSMKTDIEERDDLYEMTVELPGYTKDSLDISYNNGYLTIKAENNVINESTDEEGKMIQKERSYSNMQRAYALSNVDSDNIQASFKDGVLKITLPKIEKTIKKSIEIKEG